MVPLKPITRAALIKSLCDEHTKYGGPYGAGLGFYAYLRFHVDSMKFRRWNMDPEVLALCPPIVHPSDIASVGQPLPPAPAGAAPASVVVAPAPAAAPPSAPAPAPERGQPH